MAQAEASGLSNSSIYGARTLTQIRAWASRTRHAARRSPFASLCGASCRRRNTLSGALWEGGCCGGWLAGAGAGGNGGGAATQALDPSQKFYDGWSSFNKVRQQGSLHLENRVVEKTDRGDRSAIPCLSTHLFPLPFPPPPLLPSTPPWPTVLRPFQRGADAPRPPAPRHPDARAARAVRALPNPPVPLRSRCSTARRRWSRSGATPKRSASPPRASPSPLGFTRTPSAAASCRRCRASTPTPTWPCKPSAALPATLLPPAGGRARAPATTTATGGWRSSAARRTAGRGEEAGPAGGRGGAARAAARRGRLAGRRGRGASSHRTRWGLGSGWAARGLAARGAAAPTR